MLIRPRRNRKSESIRLLVRETILTPNDLIAPLFVVEGNGVSSPIKSMPGQFRFSLDKLIREIGELKNLGIKCVALFPVIEERLKNPLATEALNSNGLYPRVINTVKQAYPEILVMSDVALDPYSSLGHDGIYDERKDQILNDETLEVLGSMGVIHAKAGADILGPSDMMDGRVGYIRNILDQSGWQEVSIMSYAIKYASNFYGPFRDALDSKPRKGDKKTYQMDFANSREAILEALLDEGEGADILMVKPGLPYLDIIAKLREKTNLPIAAYNVSGEYSMIKAADELGWLNGEKCMIESLTALKRAGCNMIITYFAKEMASILN